MLLEIGQCQGLVLHFADAKLGWPVHVSTKLFFQSPEQIVTSCWE